MSTPSAVFRKLLSLVRHADRVAAGWIGGRAESPRAPCRCSGHRPVGRPADDPVEGPADRERVLDAIRRLPKEHAILLRWVFLEGLTIQQVAVRLSLRSTEAARKRLQRALHAVRELLQGDLEGSARDPEGGDFPRPKASGLAPSIDLPIQLPFFGRSRADLRIAIGRLPKHLARPLLLLVEEGLSAQELADRLHIGSGARAQKLVQRALRALRIALERDQGTDERRPAWEGT